MARPPAARPAVMVATTPPGLAILKRISWAPKRVPASAPSMSAARGVDAPSFWGAWVINQIATSPAASPPALSGLGNPSVKKEKTTGTSGRDHAGESSGKPHGAHGQRAIEDGQGNRPFKAAHQRKQQRMLIRQVQTDVRQ